MKRTAASAVMPWLVWSIAMALNPAPAVAATAPRNPSGTGTAVDTVNARALTLRDAIEDALQKNESIQVERAARDSADAAVSGAHGAYDPELTVDAGWSSATAPVNSAFSGAPEGDQAPTNRSTDASASLRQMLTTGASVTLTTSSSRATTNGAFALLSPAYETALGVELRQPLLRDRTIDTARLRLRVATADQKGAEAALRREITDTVAAVEHAYWNLVAARRAVAVRQDAVELAARQLDETKIRIESGALPETEVAQPRAELERRRGDLLAAKEASSRAETALKSLILGDDTASWIERIEPVDDVAIAITPIDVARAMDQALVSRPELAVAVAGIEQRKAETAFARNRVRPALDVVVSYDRYGLAGSRNPAGSEIPGLSGGVPAGLEGNLGDALSQLGNGDFDDARAALQLRLPIGNRAARADVAIAKNAEIQAEAEITRVRKAIRTEVLDAAAATETAGARIEAARAARNAAEVQLRAEEDRFEAGLSTNFLVLTRQNDLAAARLAEIEALTDYRAARTELARATGSLLEERRIEIE